MVSALKNKGKKTGMRRSILNTGRRSFDNAEDSNNLQLAEALAKCRISLSKMEQEKFGYISQNLKLIDTNVYLKDHNRKLSTDLAKLKQTQQLQDLELLKLKSVITKIKSDLENQKARYITNFDKSLNLLSSVLNSTKSEDVSISEPPSLESSFDSGLNSSSDSTDKPAPIPDIVDSMDYMVVEQENLDPINHSDIASPLTNQNPLTNQSPFTEHKTFETPRIGSVRAPKRCVLLNMSQTSDFVTPRVPKVAQRDLLLIKKRETPSRSTKAAIKTFAEPTLNSKLRRGDKHTDNFSMSYVKK